MIISVHTIQNKRVVAVCDDDLLGQVFEEGHKLLDLSSEFYRGSRATVEETTHVLKQSKNLNLVGPKIIDLALKSGVIEKENVRVIKNVPYAHVSMIDF